MKMVEMAPTTLIALATMKTLRGAFDGLASSGESVFAERVIKAVTALRRS